MQKKLFLRQTTTGNTYITTDCVYTELLYSQFLYFRVSNIILSCIWWTPTLTKEEMEDEKRSFH